MLQSFWNILNRTSIFLKNHWNQILTLRLGVLRVCGGCGFWDDDINYLLSGVDTVGTEDCFSWRFGGNLHRRWGFQCGLVQGDVTRVTDTRTPTCSAPSIHPPLQSFAVAGVKTATILYNNTYTVLLFKFPSTNVSWSYNFGSPVYLVPNLKAQTWTCRGMFAVHHFWFWSGWISLD